MDSFEIWISALKMFSSFKILDLCVGGRVIISHPQGRQALEQQREQYPEVVVSDLPDKTYLQTVAAANSFDVAEFVDEPSFYLAVLICSRA